MESLSEFSPYIAEEVTLLPREETPRVKITRAACLAVEKWLKSKFGITGNGQLVKHLTLMMSDPYIYPDHGPASMD